MPVAAASALAADLRVLPRDPAAERAALERIAAWAIQFTPAVSIAPPAEVLLEIAGSLKLFGGLKRLWARIEQELERHRLRRLDRVRARRRSPRSFSPAPGCR